MPSYLVKEATKTGDKPDKGFGPMQTIALTLQEYGQAEQIGAEWYTKATTAVPASGSTIDGEVSPSQYGLKFKKAQQPGGGGRGRSPEDTKQIVRQHSQEMALRYCTVRATQGKLPETFDMVDLRSIVDWFQRDAEEGWKPS